MPKPFAVLQYLVEHPGRLVTHDQLLGAIWPDTYVQPEVLRRYILEIRRALGDRAGSAAIRADLSQARLSVHRPGQRGQPAPAQENASLAAKTSSDAAHRSPTWIDV